MDDRAPRIEIEVRGEQKQDEQVSLQTFARASDSLVKLLDQIAKDLQDSFRVEWLVRQLRTGSAVAQVEGVAFANDSEGELERVSSDFPLVVLIRAIEAFDALEHGGDVRQLVSYPAIERLRALTGTLQNGSDGIVIRAVDREVFLSTASADRAKALLDRKYVSFGSVEGTIETLSIHQKRPYFNVFHMLDGYAIKCRSDLEVLNQANASLGSRVRVSGEIQRRYDGRAEIVQVSSVRVLRRPEELPQPEDIRGILSPESDLRDEVL